MIIVRHHIMAEHMEKESCSDHGKKMTEEEQRVQSHNAL
jgi:hypothetical protein